MRSPPSRTQIFDRTPLSGGTFAYSTFCHAPSAAVARATIRSLKAKLIARFVSDRLGFAVCPPYTTLGIEREGEIVGGVIFNRSEEHTSELQSLMRTSYAVFCLTKQNSKK